MNAGRFTYLLYNIGVWLTVLVIGLVCIAGLTSRSRDLRARVNVRELVVSMSEDVASDDLRRADRELTASVRRHGAIAADEILNELSSSIVTMPRLRKSLDSLFDGDRSMDAARFIIATQPPTAVANRIDEFELDEFSGDVVLGLARAAFASGDFDRASGLFDSYWRSKGDGARGTMKRRIEQQVAKRFVSTPKEAVPAVVNQLYWFGLFEEADTYVAEHAEDAGPYAMFAKALNADLRGDDEAIALYRQIQDEFPSFYPAAARLENN